MPRTPPGISDTFISVEKGESLGYLQEYGRISSSSFDFVLFSVNQISIHFDLFHFLYRYSSKKGRKYLFSLVWVRLA